MKGLSTFRRYVFLGILTFGLTLSAFGATGPRAPKQSPIRTFVKNLIKVFSDNVSIPPG